MKKIISAIIALFVLSLGGCSWNSAENSEQVSEMVSAAAVAAISQRAEAESSTAVTTSVTSETVIFCDKEVFEETSAEIEAKTKGIKVTPADEVYNVYPKRITYPEKTETNITAEKAEIKEEFKKDGYTVDEFRAVYPVFSGGDEAVMQKINDSIRAYIDEVYEKSKKHTEEYDFETDCDHVTSGFGFSMSICGNSRNNTELTYDINGNILSVDFYTEDYAGLAAHGAVRPVSLVFDVRTCV
ncbi:MAG: DUF4163 domain-containing protein, partial [Oscillospiraceae bacterium]|nr:DUF4163 domain-containing protein [Oscillospiraceae bacterium]